MKDDFIAMPFPANHTILDREAEECGFNKHGFLKADVHQPSPNPLPLLVLNVPRSSVRLSPCAHMAVLVLLLVLEE